MNKASFLASLLIVCAVAVSSAISGYAQPAQRPAAVEADLNSWQEFSSETGRFRIMFPGAPAESDNSAGELAGRKFVLKTTAYYLVGYHDFPENVAAALERHPELRKQLFDKSRDDLLATKAKLIEDADISVDGNPGRSIKFELETGVTLWEQSILVGNRVYQLLVTAPNESPAAGRSEFNEMRAKKFLSSFKLLEPKSGPLND